MKTKICIKRKKTTYGQLGAILSHLTGREILVPAKKMHEKLNVNINRKTLQQIVKSHGLQFG